MRNYKNAYAEVYAILTYLDQEELNKIPKDVLEVIEEYRSKDYVYELNDELDLNNQEMLPETKALLFNLFRDYLCTPRQKEKIIRMQKEERIRNEENKKQNYSNIDVFERENNHKVTDYDVIKSELPSEIKKETFLLKLLSKIKRFFKL